MKREQDSTEPGFVARLRRNIFGHTFPSKPEVAAPVSVKPADEPLPKEAKVNLVGKKIFELEGSDVVATRAPLPAGYFYPDATESANFHAELLRELPDEHALFGVPLETFAAREGNDDTLFRFRGNPRRFALVHLTWLGRTEIDADHPSLLFAGTFEEFLQREKELYGLDPPV